MQDDKNNPDNFDDLDFNEFDDIDDLPPHDDIIDIDSEIAADEEFSEFDEDWDNGAASEAAALPGKKSKIKPAKIKSSRSGPSKMIVPAAVALVALGGGAYYFLSSQNQTALPSSEDIAAQDFAADPTAYDPNVADNGSSIPMPSPIAMPEETPSANEKELTAAPIESGADPFAPSNSIDTDIGAPDAGVLTPMPNIASSDMPIDSGNDPLANDANTYSQELPLEDIGLEDNNTPSMDNDLVLSENPTETTEISAADPFAPESSDQNNIDELLLSESQNNNPIGVTEAEQPVLEQDNATALTTDNSLSEQVAEPSLDVTEEVATTLDTPAPIEPSLSNENIQVLEEKLSTLEMAVSEKDSTISALNAQLAELQARIAEQEKDIEAAEEQINRNAAQEPSTPAQAPKPLIEEETAAPTINTEPEPVKAVPVRSEEPMPKWELRSAQPGKAYIGIVGSSEVLVVQENDTIQGLGRILSVSKDSSGWVVKGANGEIRQ